MIKRFLTLILVVVLAVTQLSAQNKGRRTQVAGIAYYNFENLFDTIPNNPEGRDIEFTPGGARQWNSVKYWSKINNLARAISNFATKTTPNGPAIIGCSEIENRSVLVDLVNDPQLRAWNLQIVHHDSPDSRGVDVSLLYNPRYFKVENVTNHRVTELNFRTRDQMCVVGSLLGSPLAIIVNHWPSRMGGEERSSPSREATARLSKHIADSLWNVNPNMDVIVMGDLNDDPFNKSVAKVLGAKRDRKDVETHGFFNPFWKKLDEGIGTLAYKSAWNLFDQIIISGGLANGKDDHWHFWKAEVLNFDFLKDTEGSRQNYPKRTHASGVWLNGYSDHFPTEVFLVRYLDSK